LEKIPIVEEVLKIIPEARYLVIETGPEIFTALQKRSKNQAK